MRREALAAAAILPLLAAGCTKSGVDPSDLAPLTSEQARSVPPPPPGTDVRVPDQPAVTAVQPDPGQSVPGRPAAPAAVPPVAPAPQAPPPVTQAAAPAPQVAAIRTPARIEFAPVVGADSAKLQPLSARLAARAAQRGITLVNTGGTHVLKGYFSAFTDNRETVVIYVWDVLDAAGNRVNRIQGQQKVPAGQGPGGWSAVTPAIMEAIADRTIDDLAVWLSGAKG